jgi:hypothetical protein
VITQGIHTKTKPKLHKAIVEKIASDRSLRTLAYPMKTTGPRFHFIIATSRFWRFLDEGSSSKQLIEKHSINQKRRWRVVNVITSHIVEEG